MINIRNLYQRVAPFRLDLPPAVYNDMLVQAVRRVFREGILSYTSVVTDTVNGVQLYDISPLVVDQDIILVQEVEILNTSNNKYEQLTPVNAAEVKEGNEWKVDTGAPYKYFVEFSKFTLIPIPDMDYQLRVTYQYIPTINLQTPNLPVDAEDAIVYQAVSDLLNFNGEGQDKLLAETYRSKANAEIEGLFAQTLVGNSGEVMMKANRAFARRGY